MSLSSKIKTILKNCGRSWTNSREIKTYYGKNDFRHHRLICFMDMAYWYVRYGYDCNDYCSFKFWIKSSAERKSYISMIRNCFLGFELSSKRVYKIFLDKAAFNHRYSEFIKRGYMTTADHSWKEIEQFLDRYPKIIAKPLNDYGGRGVFLLDRANADYNQRVQQLQKIVNDKSNYIIEETIVNCKELAQIAPASLNTLRFVTVIDKEGQLHIVTALLRMGNGTNVTDNFLSGGVACPIDLVTGRLHSTAFGTNGFTCEEHPFSHFIFDGFKIPRYEECISLIKHLAFIESEARYVGWDLALTPDSIELLEANIPPGENITQIGYGKGLWYQMCKWK